MIIKKTFRVWASVPFLGVLIMFVLMLSCGKESIDSKEATAIKDKQFQPGVTMVFPELYYAEGGLSTEDPGQRTDHRFYVDSQNGLDSVLGTKAEPWKTLARVEQHMENSLSSMPAVPTAVKESNYNIYYWTRGRSVIMDSMPFVNWQSHYSFDLQSREEKISGISVPGSARDNPRRWENPDFWNYFIPSSSWAVNNGSDTPGAFDSEGNRLGMTIEPIGGLPLNDGYGWYGTPLVTALLNELDISFMHSSCKEIFSSIGSCIHLAPGVQKDDLEKSNSLFIALT